MNKTKTPIFSKENLPILISAGAVLVSLIAGAAIIIAASLGAFRPSDDPRTPVTDANGSIVEWLDPDESNWTDPVK